MSSGSVRIFVAVGAMLAGALHGAALVTHMHVVYPLVRSDDLGGLSSAGVALAEDHQYRVCDWMTLPPAAFGLARGEREIAQRRRNGVGECLALQSGAFRGGDERDGFSGIKAELDA